MYLEVNYSHITDTVHANTSLEKEGVIEGH